MSDVDIILPTGEAATVPQADLAQALAAGATEAPPPQQFGGLLGQSAAAIFGAGRTATLGMSDALLVEGANILGGHEARAEMLHGLNVAEEENPYSSMGGEAAGLFVGGGGGVTQIGSAVEAGGARVLGKGLAGGIGSFALRGAAEGAILGTQHTITEATLGDVDLNG